MEADRGCPVRKASSQLNPSQEEYATVYRSAQVHLLNEKLLRFPLAREPTQRGQRALIEAAGCSLKAAEVSLGTPARSAQPFGPR